MLSASFVILAIGLAIFAFVMYFVIRTAVLHALNSHYKAVRRFEGTGDWWPEHSKGRPWLPGDPPPRQFPPPQPNNFQQPPSF